MISQYEDCYKSSGLVESSIINSKYVGVISVGSISGYLFVSFYSVSKTCMAIFIFVSLCKIENNWSIYEHLEP